MPCLAAQAAITSHFFHAKCQPSTAAYSPHVTAEICKQILLRFMSHSDDQIFLIKNILFLQILLHMTNAVLPSKEKALFLI